MARDVTVMGRLVRGGLETPAQKALFRNQDRGYLTFMYPPTYLLLCLPLAFAGAALLGVVLERTLYRPMYGKPHLDQVLFSIGLVFMAVAAVDYFIGSEQKNVQLPEFFRQRFEFGSGDWQLGMGAYRLFIIAVCAALSRRGHHR